MDPIVDGAHEPDLLAVLRDRDVPGRDHVKPGGGRGVAGTRLRGDPSVEVLAVQADRRPRPLSAVRPRSGRPSAKRFASSSASVGSTSPVMSIHRSCRSVGSVVKISSQTGADRARRRRTGAHECARERRTDLRDWALRAPGAVDGLGANVDLPAEQGAPGRIDRWGLHRASSPRSNEAHSACQSRPAPHVTASIVRRRTIRRHRTEPRRDDAHDHAAAQDLPRREVGGLTRSARRSRIPPIPRIRPAPPTTPRRRNTRRRSRPRWRRSSITRVLPAYERGRALREISAGIKARREEIGRLISPRPASRSAMRSSRSTGRALRSGSAPKRRSG